MSTESTRGSPVIVGVAALSMTPAWTAAVAAETTEVVAKPRLEAVTRTVIRLPCCASLGVREGPVAPAMAAPFCSHW